MQLAKRLLVHRPMQGVNNSAYNRNAEVEFQLQIGPKLFPEYPMHSLAEQFYSLNKTFGIHGPYSSDVLNIAKNDYMEDQFVIGADCETLLGAAYRV